ncbi:RNA polymerase sigma factor [Pseudokineococcus sp. 1T1Z-3]|uniref:RNA polymerase sigma factor n=1 Tax=Pseudokineococcus sp. 1T1Z-3 TaxID=3132745 RepID=UPI0030AACA81
MGEVDEAGLLRAAAAGDAVSFEELYDRLAPMVLLRLRRRCADPDVVADVLQETFTAVWRSAGSWTGHGDVGAWVWTIAARRLVDAYRRRRRSGQELSSRGEEHPAAGPAAASAEDQVMDGLLAGPLEAAMKALSPELQEVLQATVLDGLSTRETAVLLGIPQGTVKTRAWRARSRLRQALA